MPKNWVSDDRILMKMAVTWAGLADELALWHEVRRLRLGRFHLQPLGPCDKLSLQTALPIQTLASAVHFSYGKSSKHIKSPQVGFAMNPFPLLV